MQAATRVNAEQASKSSMSRPTHHRDGEGCHRRERRATLPGGWTGVMAAACMPRRSRATREARSVAACDRQPAAREGQGRAG